MSIGVDAFKRMEALKQEEINAYYIKHIDVIKPFLLMQQELIEIGDRRHNAMMNVVNELNDKSKGKRK